MSSIAGANPRARRDTTLVITNDFGPRTGGIESFVAQACQLLGGDVVVLASRQKGDRNFDRELSYPVRRHPASVLLPTRSVAQHATALMAEFECQRVLVGAAAPLGLLAPSLRHAGARRVVGLTHGHEVWWARLPGSRQKLRQIVAAVDVVGTISEFTEREIGQRISPADRAKLVRIPPPVDLARFHPIDQTDHEVAGSEATVSEPIRVVAAGRFVPRKGWSVLFEAWRHLVRLKPGQERPVVLECIGAGPLRRRLQRWADDFPSGTVRIRDAVPHAQMPMVLAGARAFALPVRTPWPGIQPEGLGLGFVEAAACGIPVLVGKSGGSGDTVIHGRTGWLLDPDDPALWAQTLHQVITDASLAQQLGQRGRDEVAIGFSTDLVRTALQTALDLPVVGRAFGTATGPSQSSVGRLAMRDADLDK